MSAMRFVSLLFVVMLVTACAGERGGLVVGVSPNGAVQVGIQYDNRDDRHRGRRPSSHYNSRGHSGSGHYRSQQVRISPEMGRRIEHCVNQRMRDGGYMNREREQLIRRWCFNSIVHGNPYYNGDREYSHNQYREPRYNSGRVQQQRVERRVRVERHHRIERHHRVERNYRQQPRRPPPQQYRPPPRPRPQP